MKKIVLLLPLLLGCYLNVFAQHSSRVPAYRGVIERVQPSGDTLHIYLRGDEHSHFTMTTDGWQVRENKDGYLCYARKRWGRIVASRWMAHDEKFRTEKEEKFLIRKGINKSKQ